MLCRPTYNPAACFLPRSQLHEYFWDVPETIKEYTQMMNDEIRKVCEWPEDQLSLDEKISYLQEMRHTYGRSALLLSGGGGLGAFHIVSACPKLRLKPEQNRCRQMPGFICFA